jgi:hypothetical protein
MEADGMNYAIYFKWKDDGMEDSINVTGIQDLKTNIKEFEKPYSETEIISISKIYSNGEYVPYKYKRKDDHQ